MHVISLKKIKTFINKHPEASSSLLSWYKTISLTDFATIGDIRSSFPQTDYVKPFCVFNIGRAYRLIAAVHFNRKKVFVRHVLTHQEYDRGKWKEK